MTAVEEDALRLMEQVQGSFWERQDSAPLRAVMAAEGRSWPLPPCPDPAVALADEQYDTTPLSEDACLVRGTFRTVSLDAAMADTPRRLTAVCIRRPEGLRITHLHLSEDGPAASCREEAAGGERIRGNSAALRELIRQTSRALRERNRELEALTENIPGGVQCCRNDEEFTILNMNSGLPGLFGYTRTDIEERFGGKFARMIHPADLPGVQTMIAEQLSRGPAIDLEYRVVCRDGSFRWVLDKGQLRTTEDGTSLFYCILMDITEQKREREALRLSLERHQVILDQTADIIFEWDIHTDTLVCSPNWQKKFGYIPVEQEVSRRIPCSDNIPTEDMPAFIDLLHSVSLGVPYCETEFRIRNTAGDLTWQRIRATTQFDGEGRPLRAVGVIVDIDEEKKQRQTLLEQAQRDPHTGLYNKTSAKSRVKELLRMPGGDVSHAMLIIDVDNFKTINDRYGHLCGDAVLVAFSARLKALFRTADVVARIGGDEFLVFLPHISGRETAAGKAEEILQISRELSLEVPPDMAPASCAGGGVPALSCSVGIAMYPQDGQDYAGLYLNADRALYLVKNNGKSGFAFYERQLCSPVTPGEQTGAGILPGAEDTYTMGRALYPYIFRLLYSTADVETAVEHILEVVGRTYDVSRVYIFENSPDDRACSNTFEWCGEGVPPQKRRLQNLPYWDDLPDYPAHFDENGVFCCRDTAALPPPLCGFLAGLGVVSLLQCAVRDGGRFRGFVGFDECRVSRYWTREQIHSLTLVANILSTFLLKHRLAQRLEELSESRL